MELLVALLVEILISFVVTVIPAIVSFIAMAVTLLAELMFRIASILDVTSMFTGSPAKIAEPQSGSQEPAVEAGPTVSLEGTWVFVAFKWVRRITAGVFVVTIVGLFAINYLFLKPVTNWAFAELQQRTGIEVTASEVTGDLFTGYFEFTGLTAKRASSEKSSFDLKVAEISGDLRMSNLIFGAPVFETLYVEGVSGRFDVKKRDNSRKSRKIKTRRDFIVKHMVISDVALQFYKARGEALDATLTWAQASPLRSNYAVFDLFFRSDLIGTLAGRKLEIRTASTNDGRKTTWKIDQLPVSILGHFSDAPVISWLEQGTFDVDVTDSWNMADRAAVNMDWHLLANDVKMQVPADAGLMQKTVFIPAQKYLNGRDKPVDVSFSLVMNEEQFEGAASLEAANLWATVRDGFVKALALKYRAVRVPAAGDGKTPVSQREKTRGLVDKATDSFKGLLDKRHKAPAPEN
ncbi:MAG: hypothetical protein AAF299_07190 [Pseudomonadota bacterium]